jgi:hypothetical protein
MIGRITFGIRQGSDRTHQLLKVIPCQLDGQPSILVIHSAILTSIYRQPHINPPKSVIRRPIPITLLRRNEFTRRSSLRLVGIHVTTSLILELHQSFISSFRSRK